MFHVEPLRYLSSNVIVSTGGEPVGCEQSLCCGRSSGPKRHLSRFFMRRPHNEQKRLPPPMPCPRAWPQVGQIFWLLIDLHTLRVNSDQVTPWASTAQILSCPPEPTFGLLVNQVPAMEHISVER